MTKRVMTVLLVVLVSTLFTFSLLTLIQPAETVRAQTGTIYVDKQLGRANNTVRVGEYLTFTIFIENQSAFTVTTLPLSDTFNAAVLGFVDAVPAPDAAPVNGRLDWSDLTTYFGDLPPGQSVTVVVGFIAEHPSPAIVNAAEVHDALGSNGAIGGDDSTDMTGESIGGSAPVLKELAGGVIPAAGVPLTFSITITNNGATTMTVVPLIENYDPLYLQFDTAVPPPDEVNPVTGVLTWTDVTSSTGDIPAFGTVDLTVVFTALAAINNTVNNASVSGAIDWYGNDLAGGGDNVPITIIDDSTPTPTPQPTSRSTRAPQSTATPMPTTTATATATTAPQELPAAGIPPQNASPITGLLALAAAVFPILLWLGWRRSRT
jgi:hypothetical protein